MKKASRLSPTSWLATKNVFSQAFGVLVFAIQAPLLGPRAFGLVSIVLMFVGFCEIVLVDAASEAMISVRNLKDSHFHTMNTVSVAISLGVSVLAFFGADYVAHWFGDPELAALMRVMSVLPVISSLTAAPTASTKRDMQFQPLALRTMVSLLCGGIVGMTLALAHFGAWALVWQAIVTRVVAVVVLWMAVPLKLRFGFSREDCLELLHFAAPVMVSKALTWGGAQFPRLIFGLYWGATELGIFGLAARLGDILTEIALAPRYTVARIELRRYHDDPAGLLPAFSQNVLRAAVVCFPLAVGGAAVAPTLFAAWLDARWHDATLPAALLMLMCIPFVSLYCTGAALLAVNRQKSEALSSIVQSVVTVAVVLTSAPFGLLPASASYAARPFLVLPFGAWLLRTKLGIPAKVLFGPQLRVLAAAAAMGLGVTALRLALEPHLKAVLLLPILIAVGGVIYALAIRSLLPEVAREYAAKAGVRLAPPTSTTA